ncbi:hypothetical protein ACWCPF_34810 [Streptomyces sp. NPDC001858]
MASSFCAAAAMVASMAATSPSQPWFAGLLEAVDEVGVDLLETWHLGRFHKKVGGI